MAQQQSPPLEVCGGDALGESGGAAAAGDGEAAYGRNLTRGGWQSRALLVLFLNTPQQEVNLENRSNFNDSNVWTLVVGFVNAGSGPVRSRSNNSGSACQQQYVMAESGGCCTALLQPVTKVVVLVLFEHSRLRNRTKGSTG